MGKILCPTRGGAASYRTQDAAIGLAKEQGKPLIFLFVVDTHFLDRTERAVRPDVMVEEMARMGKFLLMMAQERAVAAGVQTEVRIRRGELREELVGAVREEGADLVILGRPTGEESAFRPADLEALVATIEEETGAEARIV
ncbi:MAG TPA: universal stress protein [Anaerolineales bacterium]|nr:universal stress protein [Anaerolineae bacterium]HIQ01061.1 universal stress protein [Anaerolineales bacterium]